ncbi:PKD domain-containing protein [Flavobacterium sp. GCM10027622]|uniref:PKD domain-containing protein n=1 Tax=unclassified Flavobacterium TaxID=196869 RepID=UPI00360F1AB2
MARGAKGIQSLLLNFDYRILLVFISILFFGAVFLFSKLIHSVDCENATFYVVAKNRIVGETIEFYNETPNASTWEWNFGDGSKNQFEKNVTHHFKNPGKYRVTLSINDNCIAYKDVVIKSIGDLAKRTRIPEIIAPKVVKVGEEVVFDYYYNGNDIFSWEWSFGESSRLDDTESNPIHVYRTPGQKKVTLIINGNIASMTSATIFVKPKDPEIADTQIEDVEIKPLKLRPGPSQIDPAEEYAMTLPVVPPSSKKRQKTNSQGKNLAPSISEEQFELLLHQVAKQSKTKDDFGPYLCEDYKIPVLINDSKIMPFDEFCKKITGKTLKISNIRLSTNNDNCVVNVEIAYKIKKHLIWITD